MSKKMNLLAEELNVANAADTNFTTYEELQGVTPTFPAEQTRSAFNAEREEKIQAGAEAILKLMPDFDPELLTLATWWENKHARAIIKQRIESNNAPKSFTELTQTKYRAVVENLQNLQDLISRMSYIVTYYKPRENANTGSCEVRIDGEIYTIKKATLAAIQEEHAGDKEAIRAEVIKQGTKKELANLVEL